MSSFFLDSPLLPLIFLFGTVCMSICTTALLKLGKFKSKELFRSSGRPLLFFRSILKWYFPKNESENLFFALSLTKQILQLGYAISSFSFLMNMTPDFLMIGIVIIAVSIAADFLARLFASGWTKPLLKLSAPFASLYLLLLSPLSLLLLQSTRFLTMKPHLGESDHLTDKSKLREMINESDLQEHLDATDQKLIASFINFKERVGKEIMVPRVDVYALAADTTIQEAAPLFSEEGYSRIPIYRESLDQILGVVLYKDLLKCYTNPSQDLKAPLETIAKPVLYAPENKKITQLLQEFRNKQIHMAIIVDEYGGTEGVVTIEDILEELVGEIEDEYDVGEEHDFWEVPGGGWVVDAKMTIHDIEERLGLSIPPNPEYETIGGYIYHCAGTIPAKGWRLSHDAFDLEVLSSNERSIKKVKLQSRQKPVLP
jgi:CBS domain containing-hemolysin-like protein